MYPLDIHGVAGESIKHFMFNNDANEKTMMQLVSEIPPQMYVVFYDRDYPSPSDPGAFVSFKKNNDQYSMQRANHGWSKNWEDVTVEKLLGYLSQCSKYNMGPESPNMMFADFLQVEDAIQYYENELAVAHQNGDHHKEADAHVDVGDRQFLRLGQKERALEHYSYALLLYEEIGERDKEARILDNMAIIYSNLKQYEKAIEAKQKQVHIYEETGNTLLSHARRGLAQYQKEAAKPAKKINTDKKWWQFWK